MRTLTRIMGAAAAVAATLTLVASAAGTPVPAALAWSPSGHDYGTIDAGEFASQEFTLTNSGRSASGALSVSLSGSEAFTIAEDACTGTSLGPRRSCAVTVEYVPATVGDSDAGVLHATGRSPHGDGATANLTGASGVPDLTLSPGDLAETIPDDVKDYILVLDEPGGTQTITVANGGTGASETLLVTGTPWVTSADDCSGAALAPGEACTFEFAVPSSACEEVGGVFRVNGTTRLYIVLIVHVVCSS